MRLGQDLIRPVRSQPGEVSRVGVAQFEKVSRYDGIEIAVPIRKTENAAGYDMVAAEDTIIPSFYEMHNGLSNYITNAFDELPLAFTLDEMAILTKQSRCKPTLVPTGYKVYLPENYSLDLCIRSSSPLKYWLILANGIGVIDADYVDNPDNEGEIFFQIINMSPFDLMIKKGEIIGQAKIVPFGITVDDELQQKEKRISGFGSTTNNG